MCVLASSTRSDHCLPPSRRHAVVQRCPCPGPGSGDLRAGGQGSADFLGQAATNPGSSTEPRAHRTYLPTLSLRTFSFQKPEAGRKTGHCKADGMTVHVGFRGLVAAMLVGIALSSAYRTWAPPSPCRQTQLSVTPASTVSGPLLGKPMLRRSEDGFFYLSADIDNHKIRFLVDTGASDVLLSAHDARRLGVWAAATVRDREVETSGGSVSMARVILDHISVAGRTFEHVPAMIQPPGVGNSLMGQSMLSLFDSVTMESNTLHFRTETGSATPLDLAAD